MYICICKAVSDRDVRRVVAEHGIVSLRELSRRTGLGTCCGKCVPAARALLRDEVRAVAAGSVGSAPLPASAAA
ncbi:(2Fe-2S)-binding protein [Fontimonas sp. SYSU GA230001]|uniref:(2Fe-2S)-binding protein n=1 Tax=Fontimonas sp. SYSU GA230001 TaxID=3142450 RepID=UPI0032B36FD0